MTVQVRAKFRCSEKKETEEGYNLVFEPVTAGSKENDEFYKWTPWGRLEMGTVNASAAEMFKAGKEYYLDFTPTGD